MSIIIALGAPVLALYLYQYSYLRVHTSLARRDPIQGTCERNNILGPLLAFSPFQLVISGEQISHTLSFPNKPILLERDLADIPLQVKSESPLTPEVVF